MKPSEPPKENPKSSFTREAEVRPPRHDDEEDEEFIPRFVHRKRRRGAATRNLIAGFVALIIALSLLSVAILLAGPRALVPVASAMLTLTLLWVLARLRLFRQRHGVFVAIGIVALLGSTIPLLEHGIRSITEMRVVTAAQPVAEDAPSTAASSPLLTEQLGLEPPDTSTGQFVRVLKDSRVLIDDETLLIKTGDVFPLEEQKQDEATFLAGDLRISLPTSAVEIFGKPGPKVSRRAAARRPAGEEDAAPPSPADAAALTQRAQQEAVRRYPALGAQGTPENESFLRTYRELQVKRSVLLEDPNWPLEVAELLAKRDGWGADDGTVSSEPMSAEEVERRFEPLDLTAEDGADEMDELPDAPPPAAAMEDEEL